MTSTAVLFIVVDARSFNHLNRNESARAAFVLELHNAGNLGEKRVVFANTNIDAGLEFGTALPDEDRSTGYHLTCKAFHPESLGMTVAAIP
jgi:hypothetical protein